MNRVSVLIISFFISLLSNAYALDIKSVGVPYVRNYTKNQYQASNQNWAITKDEKGIMYFGNSEGLLSFDGRYWQLHQVPNKPIIRSVAADGHGKVYVGAFGEIGYWSTNSKGVFAYTSLTNLIPAKSELKEEIWKIYVDNDRVLFQTFGAIYIYQNGKVSVVTQNGSYLFLFKAGARFFVGKVSGDDFFELKGNQVVPINGGKGLGTILSVLPMGPDKYLIGTAKNGLFVYDGVAIKRWQTPANDFLSKYQLNNGVLISGKYVAYGTILNGVVIVDTLGNIVQHINKLSGLQNNTVLSLYVDDEQNLWAGLDNGIDCIEINSPLYFYFDKEGKFGTVYSSIIHNGKIYLGTNQGLFYSDWSDEHKNSPFQSFDFKLIPGSQGQVWDLSLIDGQLLCGHNEGTFVFEGNLIKQISKISGGWTIKKISDNTLIQGTYTGLVVYKKGPGGWIFDHKIEGFGEPSRYVEPVVGKNQFWVSHVYKGLYKVTVSPDLNKATEVKFYGKANGLPENYNVNVFNLNGQIVFSSNNGFYTYDELTDRFQPYDQLNKSLGAFYNSNKIIAAYGHKYWFINHGHVAMADLTVPGKISLNTRQLNILSGRMVQYYENISRINNSIYLISIDDGFAIFDDADAARNDHVNAPNVLIRKIESISNKNYVIGSNNSDEIDIPFDDNSLRFSFSLPYYQQAKIRYQYFLEGYSKKWSDWTGQTQKEFANLAHGSYIFKIRAQIDDTFTSPVTELRFYIMAPWYLSYKAFLVYALLLIVAYYALKRYTRHRFELHQQELLTKVKLEHDESLKQEAIANEQRIIKIKNEQLEADLERKGRELANSTMNIVYKNELLQKISEELVALKDGTGKNLTGEQLRRIQKVIDDAMTDERDWNLFEDSFNETHENFFKKLKGQYPELVPNDLKLCAYLRMNMSSKEMASLLNITLRGVEIRRYRLRKKLNLEHDVNLTEFLMSM